MTRQFSLPALLLIAALTVLGQLAGAAPVAASSRRLNLGPLRKALAPLSSTRPLFIHTSVFMDYNVRQCHTLNPDRDLQIISLRPGCFRAVVTSRTPQGVRLKPYMIFSNNAKVWVYYRPDLRQYYGESAHGRLEGTTDRNLGIVNDIRNLSLTGNSTVLSYPALAHAQISEHIEGASSGKVLVYSVEEDYQTYRFYVRAASNTLERIEWLTGMRESSYYVSEEIVCISPISPASASKFILPPGTVNKSFPLP